MSATAPWRTALALWRLLRASLHLLWGMAVMLIFSGLRPVKRHAHIRRWSAGLLRCMGLRISIQGRPRPGATLLVANHVSWLDIPALHAAVPQARFVSKADVQGWPLLGWLIRGAGTLFIERERKRDALRVVRSVAEALSAGDTVAIFPEGTTGAGPQPLPFHANLLQAAISTATPVQLAVLRYSDAVGPFSAAVEYLGETTLPQSLWRVACAQGLTVHVQLIEPQGSAHADRRALAGHLRGIISEELSQAQ